MSGTSAATAPAGFSIRTPAQAVAAMLVAVVIYGANFVLSRQATQDGLTPHDLTALRFGIAGLLLLPLFIRRGVRRCAGPGWGRGVALAVMSGVPMTLLMNTGLTLAPASHGAAIQPGMVTVIGAVGSTLMFGSRLRPLAWAGLGIVLGGLACIGLAGARSPAPQALLGDLFFLAAGCLWGLYPLLLRRWGVDGLTSTAIVAVLSLALLPGYLLVGPQLHMMEPGLLVLHALYQGLLNGILGLWLWGGAVGVLGPAVAGRFPPLIPVVGTLLAAPVLGEWPGPLQAAGVALIVLGLGATALASNRAGVQRG